MKENLFWLYVLDARDGKGSDGEQFIKNFTNQAFRLDNLFIFQSSASAEEIHQHIKENKLDDFMYFLVDMTNNITQDTFKGMLNDKFYRQAPRLNKMIQSYKPKVKEAKVDVEKRRDAILDKISFKGIDSLNKEEKEFLDNLNNGRQTV